MTDSNGVFVTGTSTGVGKSVVAAALLAGLVKRRKVAAFKPVVTGTSEPPGEWPPDHELLATASGWQTPQQVTPLTFGPAVSPQLAAALAGTTIDVASLLEVARELRREHFLVVEGVGGLLVPLNDTTLVRDFAVELGLPLIVVGSPGLGAINHTLLTLEAARAAGLKVKAVVLNQWPSEPSPVALSNERTIAELGKVKVARFPPIANRELTEQGEQLATTLKL